MISGILFSLFAIAALYVAFDLGRDYERDRIESKPEPPEPQPEYTIRIIGSVHEVDYYGTDRVKIGCEAHSLEWWLRHYEAVGRVNHYEAREIDEYRRYLELLSEWPAIADTEIGPETDNETDDGGEPEADAA